MNFKKKLSAYLYCPLILAMSLYSFQGFSQELKIPVGHFDKVIVSPHIEVKFVESDYEEVEIHDSKISLAKINVKLIGSTLRIFLEDAQIVAKSEKVENSKWKGKQSIYNGKIATITVNYKQLKELSLRGEQKFVCESPLEMEKFHLKIYGEANVILKKVNIGTLKTIIYGESNLCIKEGQIDHQVFTNYGEAEINALGIENNHTKIISHGEAEYKVNVEDYLKITSYGETYVAYSGSPSVKKGIIIGDVDIERML
jgi:hypothetical protein